MRNKVKNLVLLLFFSSSMVLSAQDAISFFEKTDAFMKTYVAKGKVNYKKIKKEQEFLNEILKEAETLQIPKSKAATYQAFWINAYNLTVIKSVIANYPIKSPLDDPNFFDKAKHKIGGKSITLNDIENKLLRAQFNDARFHFVLVCAGLGCPPIINEAYRPETLNNQLERQTKIALNNPEFIKVNAKKKRVALSEIFKWYTSDFTDGGKSLIDYINQYREETIPSNFKTSYYSYNWNLNGL